MRLSSPVAAYGRCATLAAILVFAGLAGCLPTRSQVLTDVTSSRYKALVRWRAEGGEDEMLPQVSGPLASSDAIKLGLEFSPALKRVLEEKRRAEGQLRSLRSSD